MCLFMPRIESLLCVAKIALNGGALIPRIEDNLCAGQTFSTDKRQSMCSDLDTD